jgi:hypothetical protein
MGQQSKSAVASRTKYTGKTGGQQQRYGTSQMLYLTQLMNDVELIFPLDSAAKTTVLTDIDTLNTDLHTLLATASDVPKN